MASTTKIMTATIIIENCNLSDVVEISKKITPLAEEIRLCDNIFKRLEKIKKFELHQKLEEEKIQIEKETKKKSKTKIR